MCPPIQLNHVTLSRSIGRLRWLRGFILVALTVASFMLSSRTRAVTPAPDGGYPNFNTAEGYNALFSLTSGRYNTATGFVALSSNTSGSDNTATGGQALSLNTTGSANVATGLNALSNNTTGGSNTATGAYALFSNTTGSSNTATGEEALLNNTTGGQNTASGYQALISNTTGYSNTASGSSALFSNTSGVGNVADGNFALNKNTTGSNNTAMGNFALLSNTIGNGNTASGSQALEFNSTGGSNTAFGNAALLNNTTGSSNIALGANAGAKLSTGSNNIDIGNAGVAGESGRIRIGTKGTHTGAFIAGISGKTVSNGVGVLVNSNGQLGTILSSARYKEAIKPMDKSSEALLQLEPVTFRYKKELDPEGAPQFGLIAEQVEKVNPDLVVRDEDGKVSTVRYEAVNAMLLNEFLKEHRKVEQLEETVAQLKSALKEQAIQIRKVSDRIELSKSAPQVVAHDLYTLRRAESGSWVTLTADDFAAVTACQAQV